MENIFHYSSGIIVPAAGSTPSLTSPKDNWIQQIPVSSANTSAVPQGQMQAAFGHQQDISTVDSTVQQQAQLIPQ